MQNAGSESESPPGQGGRSVARGRPAPDPAAVPEGPCAPGLPARQRPACRWQRGPAAGRPAVQKYRRAASGPWVPVAVAVRAGVTTAAQAGTARLRVDSESEPESPGGPGLALPRPGPP
jgi:hypothetical protein